MDFELLIIVVSERGLAGTAEEFRAEGMTTALFEPGMTVAGRAVAAAVFCGTMTRSDFEPASTVPAGAGAVAEFGGNTTPSFELYMMALLPEPLPVGPSGNNIRPDLELPINAPSDPEAVTVTVVCAAATSSNGVCRVSNRLKSCGGGSDSMEIASIGSGVVWLTPASAAAGHPTVCQWNASAR
jgi:hypothetical protein